jgi:hypothetical protein
MNIDAVELADLVAQWQQLLKPLGVAHYRIDSVTIEDMVPGKALSHAGVSVAEDYDSCRFYFNETWLEGANSFELDETILHEWVHVAMCDLNNATDLARPWLPEATWDTFDQNLDHHKETLVDRVARTIYALSAPPQPETGTVPGDGKEVPAQEVP